MLILGRNDIRAIIKMADAIEVMKEAFGEAARGGPTASSRRFAKVPNLGDVSIMSAYLPGMGALGFKVVSVYPGNPTRFGMPTVHATMVYYDHITGEPLALMEGAYLTAVRAGATSGLATQHLARVDSEVVGVIGSGPLAEAQLEAMCCVRSIRLARVYSRSPSNSEAFAERMSRSLNIDILPVRKSCDAVIGTDIVITATTAVHPVIMKNWISPGVHINAVGAKTPDSRELDADLVKSAKVCVESLEVSLQAAGDIIPVIDGLACKDHIYAELGELVLGHKSGRTSADEITIFKSVGLAIEDISIAKFVYDRAKALGLGRVI